MSRAFLAAQKRMDEAAFPVRVKVALGDRGVDMLAVVSWLQDEFPGGDFAHHSQHGPGLIDGVMFYFRSIEAAQRFLGKFPGLQYADGIDVTGYASLAKQHAGRVYTEADKRGHRVPPAAPSDHELERARIARSIDSRTQDDDFAYMCNRYARGERDAVLNLFDIKKISIFNEGPRIVHPRDPGQVVRMQEGELILEQMTWGFPVALRGKKGQLLKPRPVNNARFDKLDRFWKRWADFPEHRCLIPAESYAEAVGTPGQMTCTWLSLKSAPVVAWAGLWSVSDEWGPVYTGVMTENAPELHDIHDRSPVILAPEDWATWLNAPLQDLYQFDRPWPADDVVVNHTDVQWKHGGREVEG